MSWYVWNLFQRFVTKFCNIFSTKKIALFFACRSFAHFSVFFKFNNWGVTWRAFLTDPFFQFLTNFRGCQNARAAFSSLLHWLTACLVGCHLLVVDFWMRRENSFQAMALLRSTGFTWCVRMRDLPQLSQLLVLRRSVGWNKGSIFALLPGGLSLLNRDIFIKDLTPK